MAYTINLTHRGPQVIEKIDLFDEGRYGADKLFFRGNFCCNKCLAEQVKILLGGEGLDEEKLAEMYPGVTIDDTFKATKLGIGNPLTEAPEDGDFEKAKFPNIALNRYHRTQLCTTTGSRLRMGLSRTAAEINVSGSVLIHKYRRVKEP